MPALAETAREQLRKRWHLQAVRTLLCLVLSLLVMGVSRNVRLIFGALLYFTNVYSSFVHRYSQFASMRWLRSKWRQLDGSRPRVAGLDAARLHHTKTLVPRFEPQRLRWVFGVMPVKRDRGRLGV
jgi:hypothetical protein